MIFKTETPVPEKKTIFSRRSFLKIAAVVTTAFVGRNIVSKFTVLKNINGIATNMDVGASEVERLKVEKIKLTLEVLSKKYGVEIYNGETALVRYFLNAYQNIENIGLHDKLTIQELEVELDSIMREIVKYPTNFFKKNKINRIRIIKDLARTRNLLKPDRPVAGKVIHPNQLMITSSESSVLIDLDNNDRDEYKKIIFHHEIFHNLQASIKSLLSLQKYYVLYKNDNSDGAINETYNPNFLEDTANLAGYLMNPESHKIFLKRIEETESLEDREQLQSKYDLIKEMYLDLSHGFMDEKYWDDLLNGEIIPNKNEGLIDQYWIDKE